MRGHVRRGILFFVFLTLTALPLLAQQSSVPSEVIEKIKEEGLNRSQVMQTLSYLTDVIGPRLTASPNMRRANDWTREKLTEWGLYNAHLEPWGPFGRGWSLRRFSAQVIEPQSIPLIAYPKAWSPGWRGTITAPVIYVDARTEDDLKAYKGKLKGAVVLNGAVREVRAHFEPLGRRFTEEQLARMEQAAPSAPRQGRPSDRPRFQASPEMMAQFQLAGKRMQFFKAEGALVVMEPGRGDGGTIFVQSATVPGGGFGPPSSGSDGRPGRRFSPWDKDAPKIVPQVVVAVEHYNRLVRMIQQGEKLKMAVELAVQFHDKDLMGYNTIAEIPGTDPALKDEIVMLGGHMDSWHSGTGATDNAAGVAVCMEAVRILKALNLQPRRTIRIALWSGEEQGLLGSRAYVTEHFGAYKTAPSTAGSGSATEGTATSGEAQPILETKPEYEKFSAYFNLDNGTGKIRGIYLQNNEAVGPIFREWLQPFKEMGASTVTLSNTGGTDHQSFDAIGLPGFQFIQDQIEYSSRTHHSNMDVYDRIQAEDMKQAAIIMAAFVYQTAMRDEKLPRKPAPAR